MARHGTCAQQRSRPLDQSTRAIRCGATRAGRARSATPIPQHPEVIYFAITRDYDSPNSRIVLSELRGRHPHPGAGGFVVPAAPAERNQNPNLFRDPVTKRNLSHVLPWQRHRFLRSREARARSTSRASRGAPEKRVMHRTQTVAAPTCCMCRARANHPAPTILRPRPIPDDMSGTTAAGRWRCLPRTGGTRVRAGRRQPGAVRRPCLPVSSSYSRAACRRLRIPPSRISVRALGHGTSSPPPLPSPGSAMPRRKSSCHLW